MNKNKLEKLGTFAENGNFYAHPYDSDEVSTLLEGFGLTPSPVPSIPFSIDVAGWHIECVAVDGVSTEIDDIYHRSFQATK